MLISAVVLLLKPREFVYSYLVFVNCKNVFKKDLDTTFKITSLYNLAYSFVTKAEPILKMATILEVLDIKFTEHSVIFF